MSHKFKIRTESAVWGPITRVELDGKPINGLADVEISRTVDGCTYVILKIHAEPANIDVNGGEAGKMFL